MRLVVLELGPFAANCVVVTAEHGDAALLIDPGFDVEVAIAELRRLAVEPQAIVLTHAHLDHAYGVAEARRAFPGARILLHHDELPLYRNMPVQAQMFGFEVPEAPPEDGFLADGDRLNIGGESLLVRHTPGHSPGHIVLINENSVQPLVIVGDVLFAGSIGRTDLWGGSFELLERSIREVLYRLPGNTRVVPGHGPETTIAAEMAGNPFVAGA